VGALERELEREPDRPDHLLAGGGHVDRGGARVRERSAAGLERYHCRLNHPGLVSVIDDGRLAMEARGLRASQFNPGAPRRRCRRRRASSTCCSRR
jgi:hypothetical protein